MTVKDYEDVIFFRKKEYNINGWNALDLCAEDLMKLFGDHDVHACTEAMKRQMLEGDHFIKGDAYTLSKETKVRYYCDNLRPDRRRIFA